MRGVETGKCGVLFAMGFFFSFLIFATISMMFMSKRECIRALYSEFFLCLFFAHLILFYFIDLVLPM